MSSVISFYTPPPIIRSSLLKNPSDTIPPIEELESLRHELKILREKTLERARKAGEDMRAIEESMKRMKEKEKGKAKALEKVKRERGFTPLPNGEEKRLSVQPQILHKPRMSSVPVTAAASGTSTPSIDQRKLQLEEMKKKKKKRKREDMSDIEPEPVKARKTSPLPPHTHAHSQPPKASKFPGSSTHIHPKGPNLPDFSVPPPPSLLPTRPPVPPPPIPGPSKPTEVTEDFSKSKQPSQVLVTTFYTSIEPWLRSIKEEDIGFLEYTADEDEPLVMPKLGRHYSEVWEEEDTALYGGPLPGTAATRAGTVPRPSGLAPLPKWEPSTLTEPDCMTEEHGHGPLNERLVSALIPMQNATEWKGVKAAEEAMEGRPGTNGAAAQAARDKLNVADLEDRIKNVMRYHGLLDQVPDFSEAVDDPIATALRHAQRDFRTVLATNKARKERVAAIARDRISYQEYLESRDCLDKTISTLYGKLQKKDGPKANKKKKKPSEVNGVTNGTPNGTGPPPPCPAALGLGPDEENHLVVPDKLVEFVRARRLWEDEVGGPLMQIDQEHPGRLVGFPKKSVFDGIEEEVKRELERATLPPPGGSSSSLVKQEPGDSIADSRTLKGKARARGDELEFG